MFCHVGSSRPLLKDLYRHVVPIIASKWRDVGIELLRADKQNVLDIIETNHSHDAVTCCKCVLKKWLDTSIDASWNQLITALKSPSIDLDYLATQIEQMMTTKCEI